MENKSYSLRYLPIFETDLLSTIKLYYKRFEK